MFIVARYGRVWISLLSVRGPILTTDRLVQLVPWPEVWLVPGWASLIRSFDLGDRP